MSKDNVSPIVVDYDLKTIKITNTIKLQDLAFIITPLADFERTQDDWPNTPDLRWTVIVKE